MEENKDIESYEPKSENKINKKKNINSRLRINNFINDICNNFICS